MLYFHFALLCPPVPFAAGPQTIVNVDPIWVVGHKKAGYEINAKLCSFSLLLQNPL